MNLKNEKLFMRTVPRETTNPVHWFSNINCQNAENLKFFFKKFDIPSRRLFLPLNKQPCFKNKKEICNSGDDYPGSEYAHNRILSLPSSIHLHEEQKRFIANILNKY